MSDAPGSEDTQPKSKSGISSHVHQVPSGMGEAEGTQVTKPSSNAPRVAESSFGKYRRSLWVQWLCGGAALLMLIGIILYFIWPKKPGITLIIRSTPADSEVYVDGVRRGIPMADGTTRVAHLAEKSGLYEVRVSHQGYEDSVEKVTAGKREIIVVLKPDGSSKLPPVIRFGGKDEVDMILIPGGAFMMGDAGEIDNLPRELPVEDFYIDKYEVTNRQYQKFCAETKHKPPQNSWDLQYFQNQPDSPVVGISWNDASDYARWALKRLPKEDEWEKAASWNPDATNPQDRKRRYPWGNDATPGRANVGQPVNRFFPVTASEMQGDVSWYGVNGMAGNATEWVDGFYSASGNLRTSSSLRVVRGGGCRVPLTDALTVRRNSSSELASPDTLARWVVGFRCAVSASESRRTMQRNASAN